MNMTKRISLRDSEGRFCGDVWVHKPAKIEISERGIEVNDVQIIMIVEHMNITHYEVS